MCCLVLVGLAFGIAIVLALIPLYLPTKDVTINNAATTGEIFFRYQPLDDIIVRFIDRFR